MFIQRVLQGRRRVGESLRAGETVTGGGDDEMRLKHGEPFVTAMDGVGKQARDLSLTRAADDVLMCVKIIILNMEVRDARSNT